jgi:hypothetical protein
MRDPGISISKARSVTRDTATKVRYKGAALHTCCKSLPGRAGPTHNPEPHRDRDTEFARNERGGSRGRHRKYSGNIAAR